MAGLWLVTVVPPWAPQPTPTGGPGIPQDSSLEHIDLDELLDRYGVNPDDIPVWGLQGWYLFTFLIAVAVMVLLLRAIYRGMQRPRLHLEHHRDRPPSTSRRDVLRYLVTPLFWVPLWFIVVLAVLLLAAGRGETIRPANELVIAAAVVVGGSRLLAHVNLEGAHELSKSVPLTLLSLILISGQVISLEAALVAIFILVVNLDSLSYYVFLLALWDVLFTFTWLLLVRARWRRARKVRQHERPSWMQSIAETISEAWGNTESGPAESQLGNPKAMTMRPEATSDARIRRMMLLPDQEGTSVQPDPKCDAGGA